jgi:raffinose/stachyose/melibiose transport system substrate-binding protein/xylobiose transport system substrate-binding protein
VDLTAAFDANPAWKSTFLPSVLATATLNGKIYGVPNQGVQPVAFFYNKTVFSKAGIAGAPKTWDELLTDVKTLKSKGVIPIALAGAQGWTELMYLEYLLDRLGGPSKFQAIEAGTAGAWKDPAVKQSMVLIQQLVSAGAFGTNYPSVSYDAKGSDTLLASGKAAMEVMGSWELSAQLGGSDPGFVTNKELGWSTFPTVPNGAGDPNDIAGNPSTFFSIAKSSKAQSTALAYLKNSLTDPAYVKGLIGIGDVPAISGLDSQLSAGAYADFNTFVYGLVKNAPSFTQSWDQALSPSVSQILLTNLQKVFLNQETPDQFSNAMDQAK